MTQHSFASAPSRGTFDFAPLLYNATASILYRDDRQQSHALTLAGNHVTQNIAGNHIALTCADETISLTWHALIGDEWMVWIEIVNHSRAPIQVDELHVLTMDAANGARINLNASPRDWRFFQNGWQSWSVAFARDCGNGIHTDPATYEYRVKHQPHAIPASPKTFSSEWFTVVTDGGRMTNDRSDSHPSSVNGRPSLLLGFITTAAQLSEIRLQLDGEKFLRLAAIAYGDGVRVDPGESFASEKLWIAFGDGLTLLERYAAQLGATMHARIPAQPLTGWCTWYYFYGENTEYDVIANLERIRTERLPLNVIVIDDGYQTSDGDWTSVNDEKFPNGMKLLADKIRQAGFVPGIWVAPFAANEDSQLAREHPEFLLRDESGAPVVSWIHWGKKCYSLDLSRVDVQTWLRDLFRTLSDDWGYDFFQTRFSVHRRRPWHPSRSTDNTRTSTPAGTRNHSRDRWQQNDPGMRRALGSQRWHRGCHAHRTRCGDHMGANLQRQPHRASHRVCDA